jgi:hypothetical protein
MDILLDDTQYISVEMKNYIKKCYKIHHITTPKFEINCYSNRPKKNFINKVNKCIKRVQRIYKDFPDLKKLYIYIVDCPQKRKYIDNPIHVNGGFTWLNDNKIYVYRKKEFCKVLLHEILHHCIQYQSSTYIN